MSNEEFIKKAAEIKAECKRVEDEECVLGNCPYADKKTHYCILEEIFGNSPCNWEVKENNDK